MHFTKGKRSLRNDEFQKNEKRYRYGIRKLGLGAASVILGAFLFAGVPTVSATSSVSYEVNTDSTKIDYADAGYSVVAKETPKDFIVKDERENYLTLQIIAEVVSDGTENGKTKWKELDTDYYVVSVNRNDRSLSLSIYDTKTKALKQRTDNIKNGYTATVRGFNNTEDIKLTGGINTRGALTIVIEGPAGNEKRLLALSGPAAGAEPANKISTAGIYVVPQEIYYFYEKDRETIGNSFYNTDFDASAYEQILPKYSQTGLSGDTYTLGDILVNGYRITYRPIETGVLTAAGNFKNDFTNPNYPIGETATVTRTNYDNQGNDLRIVYNVTDTSGTETVQVFLGDTPIPLRKEGTDNQPSDEYVGTVTYSGAGSFAEFVIPSMGNRLLTVANNYASPTTKMAYFYEKLPTGSVIVNYVDTEGTKIGTEFKDTTDGEVGSAYDTTVNTGEVTSDKTTERPSVITKDGKTYRLVAQATDATVGQVASDGHLTSNKEGFRYGTDDVKGQVAEGTKSITYVYEEVKGSVIVNYVDTEGTKIGTEFKDTTDGEVGSAYDTTFNTGEVTSDKTTERPSVITKDGKTYKLVAKETTATVGKVNADGSLTTNGANFNYGTDAVSGVVAEGTKSITYVYEEVKGSVIVNYVDTEGTKIGTEFKDTTDGEVGSAYDTTVNTGEVTSDKTTERPSVITKDGKTYKLVAKETTATVGKVNADGSLATNGANFNYGTDAVSGVVAEGTKSITYVYEEVETPVVKTGSVVARYVIEGTETEIADDKTVKPTDTPVDEVYGDTPPTTISFGGKTYTLVRTRTNDGDAPSNGTVVEGEQTITYEYKEKEETPVVPPVVEKQGKVIVHYVDENGNVIKTPVVDTENGTVGGDYDTSDNRPKVIVFNGKRYILVESRISNNAKGKVVEGETHVTYIYKQENEEPTTPNQPTTPSTIPVTETAKVTPKTSAILPETGESTSALALVGLALLGTVAVASRRRKEK